MPDIHAQLDSPARTNRPWRSRAVGLAIVVSLVGLAMWVYAVTAGPNAPHSGDVGPPMTSGFTERASAAHAPTKTRFIDSAGPAVSKFGLSFLAGFGLGFASRKFLRWTMLLGAIAGAGLYFAHKAGLIQLSSTDLERHVQEGVNLAATEAGRAQKFLTGYIPSATAAAIGSFLGFRRG